MMSTNQSMWPCLNLSIICNGNQYTLLVDSRQCSVAAITSNSSHEIYLQNDIYDIHGHPRGYQQPLELFRDHEHTRCQSSKHHAQSNRVVIGIIGFYNVHSSSNKATTAQYYVDRLNFKKHNSLFITYKRLDNFNQMFPFYILTNSI